MKSAIPPPINATTMMMPIIKPRLPPSSSSAGSMVATVVAGAAAPTKKEAARIVLGSDIDDGWADNLNDVSNRRERCQGTRGGDGLGYRLDKHPSGRGLVRWGQDWGLAVIAGSK